VWPVLFNVFAIRGEEYRDPTVLLTGLDHLLGLKVEHLVGAHGIPISGRDAIARRVGRYRDAIQFLWDQTVRLANRGFLSADLGLAVQLPPEADDDNLTAERYGVAEHHFRQIRSGLFGWFDGDESQLFPLPSAERARRLVAGFGGAEIVRDQARAALADDDLRWALELSSWLVRSGDDADDRALLAAVLRTVAQRTPAANIRNWCLTVARDLDGSDDLSRFRTHRLRTQQVAAMAPVESLALLRVMLDPHLAEGLDTHVGVDFVDGPSAGLHVRRCVSVVTDGSGASDRIRLETATWARMLGGAVSLADAIAAGEVVVTGSASRVLETFAVFENAGLRGSDAGSPPTR